MAMITVLPLELTSCGAVAPMTSAVYVCCNQANTVSRTRNSYISLSRPSSEIYCDPAKKIG